MCAARSDIISCARPLGRLDICAHQAALRLAQDRYFDGHPILFWNIEDKLMRTMQFTKDVVERFNVCVKLGERANTETTPKSSELIDVEKMMSDAKENARLDILGETGDDEAYRIFREMTKEPAEKST